MKGKFRKAYRADLPGARTFEDVSDPDPAAKGVDLILARSGSQLHLALEAVSAASNVLCIISLKLFRSETTDQECGESARKGKERVEEALLAAGASSVVFIDRRIDGSAEARRILLGGLRQIRNRKDEQPDGIWDDEDKDTFLNSFSEKAQVLFDIRKCRTGDSCDLLCTGGCLDLVRGSLTCTTEEALEGWCLAPIPVTIIAGSFACGKTTLCNELLDTVAPERHMAVISHRFAEEYACQPVVVDESRCGLLEEVYDYGSGCLCCTPGGELNQRLNNMLMWGERYDHVLIRTGPAADPLLFADAVQRSSAYRITGLVTVVDSGMLCFAEQLLFGASLEQLRAADLVLLRVSKVGEDLEALMRRLHELLGKQDL
eukprot:symbB.v1.2.016477.t1/scaffold1252.1/size200744/25